jgi:hypothetical protein
MIRGYLERSGFQLKIKAEPAIIGPSANSGLFIKP